MRLPFALLLAALLAGCAVPATPSHTVTVTGDGSGTSTSAPTTSTTTPTAAPTTPPGPALWLVEETGNLTLEGGFAPNGACSRTVPDGAVDPQAKLVLNDTYRHLPAATAAVLFTDPAISWAYLPAFCGGDQLFPVAPAGNQTLRDGTQALRVEAVGGQLRLDGQPVADGQSVARHVDVQWSDSAGAHRIHGDVTYTASAGWHLGALGGYAGDRLYWGPALA